MAQHGHRADSVGCITTIREDTRQTTYLYQRLSIALQMGKVLSPSATLW